MVGITRSKVISFYRSSFHLNSCLFTFSCWPWRAALRASSTSLLVNGRAGTYTGVTTLLFPISFCLPVVSLHRHQPRPLQLLDSPYVDPACSHVFQRRPLQVLRLLGVWKAMAAAGSNAGGKLHPCWRVWAASASLHCGCLRAHPHDAEQRIKPAGRNETQGGGARQHLLIWLRSWKRCRRRPKACSSGLCGVPALETAWGARRRPVQRRSSSSTGGPARSCWTGFIALKQVKFAVSIRWRCSGALSIYLTIYSSIYLAISLTN